MIIKELDFTKLSREEYIYIIKSIMYWFKIDYENFTEEEEKLLKETIKKNEIEWKKKI